MGDTMARLFSGLICWLSVVGMGKCCGVLVRAGLHLLVFRAADVGEKDAIDV